ncbi:DUF488 family protein, N3 subclade [Scatolibacter rhodanostii]|uniref:DUF488 family protein, N3 subclade n=1 Tax=Scatolibacter rhodanostii TaxID=2014781 RepID=UPI000C06EBEA|nr:DUF488 family protein [Scatolibacter rhodanostii]
MIEIKSIRNCKTEEYDEVWAIVRSLKSKSNKIRQVKELSPTSDLFFKYLKWKKDGVWNETKFKEEYVPQFLQNLKYGQEKGYEKLNELYQKDKDGKKIALLCFCTDEKMCHRSIIAGLLQGVNCSIQTETQNDYSFYFEKYKNLK